MFRKWFNRFWSITTDGSLPLTVGSRIKTPYGEGVIVKALVTVDLDPGSPYRPSSKHPRANITMPVERLETKQ